MTRRAFVATGALTGITLSGVALSGVALVAGCNASPDNAWEFLSNEQARSLAVICDEIIPADDFPSASQAGVLTYIDRQLMRHYRRHRRSYVEGLQHADAWSLDHYGRPVAEVLPEQRAAVVAALEHEEAQFFELVRNHTLEGYYGSPRHGGNRNGVSWRMLGLAEPPVRGRAQYDLTKSTRS